ncbi:MAG: hypothetical protein WC367_02840 [Methanoregula sp.]|jgi:hypothetical protein
MADKEWKNKLLSSSLPLEFEVGKILKSKKFCFSYDYLYSRDKYSPDNGSDNLSDVYNDFSVDLHAWDLAPFGDLDDDTETTAWLELLIECKYAQPNKKWLFLPDLTVEKQFVINSGNYLNIIDTFSKKFAKYKATESFDKSGPFCYKGTEIDTNTGICSEYPIRKGVSQLQYALPRLINEYIEMRCEDDMPGNPLFYCPILVTTADLMVLNRGVTIKKVTSSTDLKDIAKSIPYLFLYSDCGPDFQKHCAKQCEELEQFEWPNLDDYRLSHGEREWELPTRVCKGLSNGEMNNFFSQFVICSLKNFPAVLQKIKNVTTYVSDHMEETRI